MLTNFDLLLNRLKDAEYVYLLLEPLPLFGILFGLIFFAVGLYMAQDKCRMAALIVIAACCASVIPYNQLRAKAMPRVLENREGSYRPGIRAQTNVRYNSRWVYYILGWTSLIALIGGGKFGDIGNYAVLVLGIIALFFSAWLHMKEAEVYHPNLRKIPSKLR